VRGLALLASVLGCILSCLIGPAGALAATGNFFIRGGGYGHGIGMSQYGAYGYAQHGYGYAAILAHYYSGTTLGQTSPTQTVRVLLSMGTASITGAATAPGGKRLNPAWTYTVSALSNGSLAITQLNGVRVGQFPAPLSVTGPGPLTLGGLGRYRGALEFRPDGHGGVQSVDAIGLDDYVRGVIGLEMSSGWPAEALKTQAVAARTYAITTSVAGNGYSLYRDTRSQVYGGVAAESAATDAAVAGTRGQVVTYQGRPVFTPFFSSSGGYTENIENVWTGAAPDAWLRGVPDPYDSAGGNPLHSWGRDLTLSSAAARLGSLVKGDLVGIRVLRHGASPRILLAQVVGSAGTTQVTGGQLGSAFGLLTTYAAFTSITTFTGLSAATAHAGVVHTAWSPAHMAAAAAMAVVPPLRNAAAAVGLHGVVYPGNAGEAISVQKLASSGWQTVSQAKLGTGGAFAVSVSGPGQYRILYQGLYGPTVSVA
jgi:stage II sporulation protein D